MSATFVLAVLKFAGFGVAAASALWGMTTRTTFDDEQRRKRLTAAGHVAVALVVCSSLIGAGSFGLETLAKQNADRAAIQAKRDEAQAKRDETARQEARQRTEAAERRASAAEQRADAAYLRAAAADQRAMALAEVSRDMELSRQVNLGTQANLAKAELALAQLERVNNPLGDIRVSIDWTLPGQAAGMTTYRRRLAAFAARVAADPNVALNEPGIAPGGNSPTGRVESMFISPSSALYPSADQDRALYDTLGLLSVNIALFAAGASAQEGLQDIAAEHETGPEGVSSRGDLWFVVSAPSRPPLLYIVDTQALGFTISQVVPEARMKKTGLVVSVPDLERGLLAFDLSRGAGGATAGAIRAGMRPSRVVLSVSGRDYRVPLTRVRMVTTPNDRPAFTASPVSAPAGGPVPVR